MDLAIARALRTAEGQQLLSSLPRPYDPAATLSLTAALRGRGYSPELIAAALTQSELRTRAERKFGEHAHRLLLTRDGLEQSSRAAVARLHATRFADRGIQAVHDLGCGIGADSSAFAQAGIDVDAVESDPVIATLAEHNLSSAAVAATAGPAGPAQVRVHQGQAEDPRWPREARRRRTSRTGLPPAAGVWLDPGRRRPGVADASGRTRRTRSLELMSPSWETVQALVRQWPAAGAKLGAGFEVASLPPGAEGHWVSHDGEAVECVVWWGALAPNPDTVSALVHSAGRWHRLDRPSQTPPSVAPPAAREVAGVLYELDPAVAAAGLRTHVGELLGARPVGSFAYLTGDHLVQSVWARAWRVHEVVSLRPAALRRWARREDVGPLTVKRPARRAPGGQELPDGDLVRRRAAPNGSRAATLVLTDVADRAAVAVWVSPSPTDGTGGPRSAPRSP